MKLKYLIYVLSVLALIGVVSAGTYSHVTYNGMFKVTEVKTLSSKFDKNQQSVALPVAEYDIEKSFVMHPYAGYETCFRSKDGCLSCDSTMLNDGYGEVTNYVGLSTVRSSCAKQNEVNGFSQNAFRDGFVSSSCDFKEKETKLKFIAQFGTCGNLYN